MLPNKKKYYPATERQKASWKEYIENGKKLYLHIGNVLDLHKPDPHSIKKTVNALVIRHESLRTTFETNEEGTAVQVVHDSESFKIEIEREDCSAEPSPLQKAESIMREMTNELWDLEKGPLVRLKLVHLGEGEARLRYGAYVFFKEPVEGSQYRLHKLQVKHLDSTQTFSHDYIVVKVVPNLIRVGSDEEL